MGRHRPRPRAEPREPQYEGKRIAEIAKLRGDADPADTCITLMAEEGGNDLRHVPHHVGRGRPHGDEAAVGRDRQRWVGDQPQREGVPHPRSYSTNVRVLGHYVRDEKVLTLDDAMRKMTRLPAQILGLRDRGQIHEGFAADVAVFDPARLARRTRSRSRSRTRKASRTCWSMALS